MTAPRYSARLYRWFARDAEAEGHPNPLAHGWHCPVCDTRLDKQDRPCPMGCQPKDAA